MIFFTIGILFVSSNTIANFSEIQTWMFRTDEIFENIPTLNRTIIGQNQFGSRCGIKVQSNNSSRSGKMLEFFTTQNGQKTKINEFYNIHHHRNSSSLYLTNEVTVQSTSERNNAGIFSTQHSYQAANYAFYDTYSTKTIVLFNSNLVPKYFLNFKTNKVEYTNQTLQELKNELNGDFQECNF